MSKGIQGVFETMQPPTFVISLKNSWHLLPSDDAAVEPGVLPDPGAVQDRAPLDAHPVLDDDAGPQCHVGPYPAVVANLIGEY